MNKENQHKEALPYGVVSNDGISLYNAECLEVMDYLISLTCILSFIVFLKVFSFIYLKP